MREDTPDMGGSDCGAVGFGTSGPAAPTGDADRSPLPTPSGTPAESLLSSAKSALGGLGVALSTSALHISGGNSLALGPSEPPEPGKIWRGDSGSGGGSSGGCAHANRWLRRRRKQGEEDGARWDGRPIARDAALGALLGALLAFCCLALYLVCADRPTAAASGSACSACKSDVYGGGGISAPFSRIYDWMGKGAACQACTDEGDSDGDALRIWRRLRELGVMTGKDERGIADMLLGADIANSSAKSAWYRRGLQQSSPQLPPSGPPLPAFKGSKAKLVVAGKMIVEEGQCNIAQFDLGMGDWSLTERIQLSLYKSYSGGEVYMMLANHTFPAAGFGTGEYEGDEALIWPKARSRGTGQTNFGGELIVVGAFDTTYRNSQVTYCSVGKWDGDMLSKVGEGLCNSALSKGMKITCAALAGPQDVYVAGSFHTQVWNGDRHEFVKIFNIAHYNAVDQVWLPLPVGQITCSWCTVTVLALVWDSQRKQLHVAGKFNAIDGMNIPAGLAIYDHNSGHLVAHPGGGLTMMNGTQDGVGTALQLDEESGVLYVMGSFERLTATSELCAGIAAYEIEANHWTCLADAAHSVLPTGGGNMLLTPFGLMVAGKTTSTTTWPDSKRPYTIALLKATPKTKTLISKDRDNLGSDGSGNSSGTKEGTAPRHDFNWSWLPGFDGWMEPLHTLSNGFGDFENVVFIGGDNLVAKWYYEEVTEPLSGNNDLKHTTFGNRKLTSSPTLKRAVCVSLSEGHVRGSIMAISQMNPPEEVPDNISPRPSVVGYTIVIYCVTLGALFGMFLALMCNRNLTSTILSFIFERDAHMKGISLDTLTYSAVENTNVAEAYQRAMRTRFVQHPHLLTLIDPQEIILHRIIGEGTFGRVWSAKWRSSSVAVKEFVFAQAAVAGKSSMKNEIIEEIIGEAGMMAILRQPNVLQLFGCSLTAQAIWIVSELCSLGSLRQLLDDQERELPLIMRTSLALQVAEGMVYLHTQDPPIIHRDLKSHNILCHETYTETDTESPPKQKSIKKEKKGSRDKHKSGDLTCSNGSASSRPPGSPLGEKVTSESTIVAKIGDWGSARATLAGSRTMTHGVGTACWLAPEVIKHARSSKFSDVYGFGIVLWELATREEVYQGLESTQIIAKVANDNLRPPIPDGCPWTHIMTQCWKENPEERLSFEEIVIELNKIKETLSEDGGSKGSTSWNRPYSSYQQNVS